MVEISDVIVLVVNEQKRSDQQNIKLLKEMICDMTKKNTQKKLFILHNWKQCYSSEECEDKIDTEIR